MIVLLVSFEKLEHAETMANYLIDNKLAACVELYPVTNFYVWDGKKQQNKEISGVIKTVGKNFEKIQNAFKELISYDIPQIIKVEATANDSYLQWVKESVEQLRGL